MNQFILCALYDLLSKSEKNKKLYTSFMYVDWDISDKILANQIQKHV